MNESSFIKNDVLLYHSCWSMATAIYWRSFLVCTFFISTYRLVNRSVQKNYASPLHGLLLRLISKHCSHSRASQSTLSKVGRGKHDPLAFARSATCAHKTRAKESICGVLFARAEVSTTRRSENIRTVSQGNQHLEHGLSGAFSTSLLG